MKKYSIFNNRKKVLNLHGYSVGENEFSFVNDYWEEIASGLGMGARAHVCPACWAPLTQTHVVPACKATVS